MELHPKKFGPNIFAVRIQYVRGIKRVCLVRNRSLFEFLIFNLRL